jgi:transcriptional regulator with XRE-family HTH domain
MRFRHHRQFFFSMPSKVPCYLRTLRKKWGLTQKELASLVPRCRRNRVSDVERGKIPPRASELLAYALIFGFPPQAIFRKYAEEIEDAVMRGAAELDRRLADDDSPPVARKIDFLEQLSNRARLEASEIPNL